MAKIAVFGGTGTIGQHVVSQLVQAGHTPRVLTRDASRASSKFGSLAGSLEFVEGDLLNDHDVTTTLEGTEGVIMTHGAPYGSDQYEQIDHGAVTSVIRALDASGSPRKVALMTSIGVSHSSLDIAVAKRRGEQDLRASGLEYTIVRPGWFKSSLPGDPGIVLQQGDTEDYGDVLEGHVAQALIEALFSDAATGKSFEVFSRAGTSAALPQAFEELARDS